MLFAVGGWHLWLAFYYVSTVHSCQLPPLSPLQLTAKSFIIQAMLKLSATSIQLIYYITLFIYLFIFGMLRNKIGEQPSEYI